jgi:hypothetical protein
MRTPIRFVLAALVIAPAITPVAAQGNSSFSVAPRAEVRTRGTGGSVRLTAEEIAMIEQRIIVADAKVVAGDFRGARTILRDVAEMQARGGGYPAATLRRLANVEFSLNHPLAAAAILERAADAARAVGDPQFEVQALVDAMVVYGQEGRRNKARDLRPRIEGLLNSPAISEELRQKLARHLITE